ncbi:MAG: hypothetical protein AAB116_17705 [Candidatus Poribacteria bacterium]
MRQWGVLYIFLILAFVGCGDDASDTVIDEPDMLKSGLNGDTYFNPKYGIKITKLPVDTWTIKALGSDGLGFHQAEVGMIPLYWLLLMEPVPTNQFIGLDENASADKIVEAKIPFIAVVLNYNKGGKFETYDLTQYLNDFTQAYSLQIESKKSVYIGNSLGLQAVFIDPIGLKSGVTWFAKGEVMVRCEFHSTQPDFDKYYPAYEQVVNNIWLMGK